jgi:hypothetical protein
MAITYNMFGSISLTFGKSIHSVSTERGISGKLFSSCGRIIGTSVAGFGYNVGASVT